MGRHGETHRCQEHHVGRLATSNAAHEHEDAYQERRDCQSPASVDSRRWSGVRPLSCSSRSSATPSEGRLHPGRHDHAHATIGHRGATEGHVPLVGEDRRGDIQETRSRDLAGGLECPRQGGLSHSEGSSLDQAHVGSHDAPRRSGQPGQPGPAHVGRRDDDRDAGTNDARRRAGHAFQRVHRLLRSVFLDEPDDPVERDDGQDDGGVLEVADGRGDRGRTEQDWIIALVNCSASSRQAGLPARSSSSFGP